MRKLINDSRTIVYGAFTFSIVLFLGIGYLSYLATRANEKNLGWVLHTHEVLMEGGELYSEVKDAQRVQRGYLLTEDTTYLTKYESSKNEVYKQISILQKLTADQHVQQQRLEEIAKLVNRTFAYFDRTVSLYQNQENEAALELVRQGTGRDLAERIRALTSEFIRYERVLLHERQAEYESSKRFSHLLEIGGGILAILLLSLAFSVLIKLLKREKFLSSTLDQKVQDRTKDLEIMADRFQFMTNAIPQIVWTATPKGDVDFYNQVWYKYTGLSKKESLSNGWVAKIHPDDKEQVVKEWNTCLENGVPYEQKLRMANARGNFLWFLARGIPMKDSTGTIVQWFGTNTNIHDQVLKTEELERVNEELDSFVYAASHDLRTPVINLNGIQQVLKKSFNGGLSAKQEEFFKLMGTSIERLDRTVMQLADIAKISKEEQPEEAISFSDVFQEVVADITPLVEQTNAKISTQFDVDQINYPYAYLKSILYNLLSNAIKYHSPDRTPEVNISTISDRGRICMTVTDNGLGLDPNQINKLFTMYKRLHTHVEGSGVGLTMVKRIVENKGGKIKVYSKLGEGSTFKIEF